jgi:hypothetical protein
MKKMMVIVIKIQQSIVEDISNKKQMRHPVNPMMLIRKNGQGMRRRYIIRSSLTKHAMHVILQRTVVTLDSSITTTYSMLMPSSR